MQQLKNKIVAWSVGTVACMLALLIGGFSMGVEFVLFASVLLFGTLRFLALWARRVWAPVKVRLVRLKNQALVVTNRQHKREMRQAHKDRKTLGLLLKEAEDYADEKGRELCALQARHDQVLARLQEETTKNREILLNVQADLSKTGGVIPATATLSAAVATNAGYQLFVGYEQDDDDELEAQLQSEAEYV